MVSFQATTIVLLLLVQETAAFSPGLLFKLSPPTDNGKAATKIITNLSAKKKGQGGSGGKGFAKAPLPSLTKEDKSDPIDSASFENTIDDSVDSGVLSSIQDSNNFARSEIEIDPNAPVEERTKSILKNKYGLRSLEEQQGDIRAAERKAENSKRMKKIKEMSDEEFDIFELLPPSLLKAIDLFLKTGLTVTTILFVLAGIGITIEAWAVSTKHSLPESVDGFIVNVIEPNFTIGLGVLLGFSISLGLFATAQLGSKNSSYREEP